MNATVHGNQYAEEYLLYMNNINITFDKNNINNNDLGYMINNIDNEYIRKNRNIIVNCFETFINKENQDILDQTHYILFDHYNMPMLKLINSNMWCCDNESTYYYAKFKV
jgi:hypothetical protein